MGFAVAFSNVRAIMLYSNMSPSLSLPSSTSPALPLTGPLLPSNISSFLLACQMHSMSFPLKIFLLIL